MLFDEVAFADTNQLVARGWTRALIKHFLINPDRWGSVNHWANFKGKAEYSLEKVIRTENNEEFIIKFNKSIKKRKLNEIAIKDFIAERTKANEIYKNWLKELTPNDIKLMIVANDVATIFEETRAIGYRTSHK